MNNPLPINKDYLLDNYFKVKVQLEEARLKAVEMNNIGLVKRIERDMGYIISTFVAIKEDVKEESSC